jgi:hypothetical protein
VPLGATPGVERCRCPVADRCTADPGLHARHHSFGAPGAARHQPLSTRREHTLVAGPGLCRRRRHRIPASHRDEPVSIPRSLATAHHHLRYRLYGRAAVGNIKTEVCLADSHPLAAEAHVRMRQKTASPGPLRCKPPTTWRGLNAAIASKRVSGSQWFEENGGRTRHSIGQQCVIWDLATTLPAVPCIQTLGVTVCRIEH